MNIRSERHRAWLRGQGFRSEDEVEDVGMVKGMLLDARYANDNVDNFVDGSIDATVAAAFQLGYGPIQVAKSVAIRNKWKFGATYLAWTSLPDSTKETLSQAAMTGAHWVEAIGKAVGL